MGWFVFLHFVICEACLFTMDVLFVKRLNVGWQNQLFVIIIFNFKSLVTKETNLKGNLTILIEKVKQLCKHVVDVTNSSVTRR